MNGPFLALPDGAPGRRSERNTRLPLHVHLSEQPAEKATSVAVHGFPSTALRAELGVFVPTAPPPSTPPGSTWPGVRAARVRRLHAHRIIDGTEWASFRARMTGRRYAAAGIIRITVEDTSSATDDQL